MAGWEAKWQDENERGLATAHAAIGQERPREADRSRSEGN